jgi:hypothetical protein
MLEHTILTVWQSLVSFAQMLGSVRHCLKYVDMCRVACACREKYLLVCIKRIIDTMQGRPQR